MPTLTLAPQTVPMFERPGSGYGYDFAPVTVAARPRVGTPAPRRGVTVAGVLPHNAVSDYATGEGDPRRAVFLSGCFRDYLAMVAAGRAHTRLLVGHDWGRQLACTRDGSLRLWEAADGLRWRAELKAAPPVPVVACSAGFGVSRWRHHRFASGETVRVYESAHVLELSLVARGAFGGAKAWVVR